MKYFGDDCKMYMHLLLASYDAASVHF